MPPHDVVDVDAGDRQHVDIRDIAGGSTNIRRELGAVDQQRVRQAELLELAAQRLGLGVLHVQRLDDNDAVILGLGRERMLERQRADLFRQADLVAAGLRAERAAAAAEQVDPRRAVTRRAGALLPVHLLAGAVDVGAVLHLVRAGLALGQLPHHAAMNEVGARLEPEDGVGHRDRTGFLAVERRDLQFHVTRSLRLGRLRQGPSIHCPRA